MRFDVTGLTAQQVERLVPVIGARNVFLYRNGSRAFLAEEIELEEGSEYSGDDISEKSEQLLAKVVGKSV